jgi:hypothetical protein
MERLAACGVLADNSKYIKSAVERKSDNSGKKLKIGLRRDGICRRRRLRGMKSARQQG